MWKSVGSSVPVVVIGWIGVCYLSLHYSYITFTFPNDKKRIITQIHDQFSLHTLFFCVKLCTCITLCLRYFLLSFTPTFFSRSDDPRVGRDNSFALQPQPKKKLYLTINRKKTNFFSRGRHRTINPTTYIYISTETPRSE